MISQISNNEIKEIYSFRDPSGFIFFKNNKPYRQINLSYKKNYEHLMNSGLYNLLIKKNLLIKHEEVKTEIPIKQKNCYKIIKPDLIPFISYPYEWCFSQIKAAALSTLAIQKKSLEYGMSLKDASAYNIQFKNNSPILIDSLSFEKYRLGEPWVAYRQFCQHFLAPLSLMAFKDVRLAGLLKNYIDGIPLNLTSAILPVKTYLNFGLLLHIHLHAKSQQYYADKAYSSNRRKMNKNSLIAFIESLEKTIKKLKWKTRKTEWGEYYESTNYSPSAFSEKKKIIEYLLDKTKPKNLWDLGANTGEFSRLCTKRGISTIAFDIDYLTVERNYHSAIKNKNKKILPLFLDLTNPSPAIGWANAERQNIIQRGSADAVMALALIHHLCISNNLPFQMVAEFMKNISRQLIIEFVPKSDSKVQKLLSTREDIFPNYNEAAFEQKFSRYFNILEKIPISGSKRTIYLMKRLK